MQRCNGWELPEHLLLILNDDLIVLGEPIFLHAMRKIATTVLRFADQFLTQAQAERPDLFPSTDPAPTQPRLSELRNRPLPQEPRLQLQRLVGTGTPLG